MNSHQETGKKDIAADMTGSLAQPRPQPCLSPEIVHIFPAKGKILVGNGKGTVFLHKVSFFLEDGIIIMELAGRCQ